MRTKASRQRVASGLGFVLLAAVVGFLVVDGSNREDRIDSLEQVDQSRELVLAEQRAAIEAQAAAIDALRAQVERCSDEEPGTAGCEVPVAPPADEIVDEPVAPPAAGLDAGTVRAIAEDVMAGMLPGAARGEIHDAVADAHAECVASGACVGPAPPAEEVLALVTAAVAAFCADDACEGQAGVDGLPGAPGPPPSPEEIAAAVAAYCATGACQGPPGYPVSLVIQLTNGQRLVCTDVDLDRTYTCL